MHNGRKECTGGPSANKDRGKCQKIGKNFREIGLFILREKNLSRKLNLNISRKRKKLRNSQKFLPLRYFAFVHSRKNCFELCDPLGSLVGGRWICNNPYRFESACSFQNKVRYRGNSKPHITLRGD